MAFYMWRYLHLRTCILCTFDKYPFPSIYDKFSFVLLLLSEAAADADKNEKGKGNIHKTGVYQLSGFIIESLAKSLPSASHFLEMWAC